MNSTKRIFPIIKSSGIILRTVLGFLSAHDYSNSNRRPQSEGSDIFGEHNFRTGQSDSGTDPDGWYEEDM